MRILTEASGSITSNYIFKAIKESRNTSVASDITEECYAKYIADEFILMPKISEEKSWERTVEAVLANHIDIVIPSLDETLELWSKEKDKLKKLNILVAISDFDTLNITQDKWKTYLFFESIGIPTPRTSLDDTYDLIKPRLGRGSNGIFIKDSNIRPVMAGNISQEIIEGVEYTVDVFCDKENVPIYIVPRKRLQVKEGKSTMGTVVKHEKIESYVKVICSNLKFLGPINIQCFEDKHGDIKFIEINPRLGGGMALGFAATENWIELIVNHFIKDMEIKPVDIKYNLKMMRYYNEIFILE